MATRSPSLTGRAKTTLCGNAMVKDAGWVLRPAFVLVAHVDRSCATEGGSLLGRPD